MHYFTIFFTINRFTVKFVTFNEFNLKLADQKTFLSEKLVSEKSLELLDNETEFLN